METLFTTLRWLYNEFSLSALQGANFKMVKLMSNLIVSSEIEIDTHPPFVIFSVDPILKAGHF